MAVLKMLTGPMTGDLVALAPEGLQIGRGESNQLRIVEASVSSRHARIWQERGEWWLQDLGSTNGTLINNAEAPANAPVPLTSGDKLAFGHVVATFDALMDLAPLEPEPLVEVAPAPDLLAEANGRIEALQSALTAAQQQLAHVQSADLVPRSEIEAGFAAERDAFRRQLREMEQKLVDQAAEVQAFQRSIEQKGVQGGLPSKEREALEASERERATLEEALSQATDREQALQAQLDTLHKELREISGVRRVAAADAEEGQRRADTLEQQIVVLERAVAVAQQDEEQARHEAARVDALHAELEAARANADALTTRLAEAESFGNELRRELDRQQQATVAQEADLAAVRQQGVQLREKILVLEQRLADAEGAATDELDTLRAQGRAANDRNAALEGELEQARASAALLEAKLAAVEVEVAEKTSTITELEARLTQGDEGAQAAVEAARAESVALQAERDELRAAQRELCVERDELLAKIAADAEAHAALQAQLAAGDEGAKAAIEAARDEAAALHQKLALVESEVAAKAEIIASLQTQLAAGDEGAKAAIEAARDEAAALHQKLALVESEVAAKTEIIETLETQLAAGHEGAKAAIEAARDEAAALHEKLATLEARLAAGDEGAKAAMQAAQAEASGLREQLVVLEDHLSREREAASTQAASLQEQVSRLELQAAAFEEIRVQALSEAAALDEQLASLRNAMSEMQAQSPVASSADWDEVEYARAQAAMLRGLLESGTEAVNGEISRVRRNAEIFRGYLDDVARVASFVTALDASELNPSEQAKWQELVDEVGPSEVVAQLRAMADENADAASNAKGLVLDLKNAVAASEPGTDLEQALLAGQGFLPEADLSVESSDLLPLLACETSHAVLFGFALVQEAKELGEGSPSVVLASDGNALRLELGPLSGRTRSRWTETAQGGGDDRSRFLHGFVTRTCRGDVSVDDTPDGCRLVFVFNETHPG